MTSNPLDRIRSLAPADMTDDELGVAVLLAAKWRTRRTPQPEVIGPRGSFHECVTFDCGDWHYAGVPNPALSYDALLPIVREWAYKNEATVNASTCGSDEAVEWHEWFHISPDGALWCRTDGNPRQLAEAFVTAAREVADGH